MLYQVTVRTEVTYLVHDESSDMAAEQVLEALSANAEDDLHVLDFTRTITGSDLSEDS